MQQGKDRSTGILAENPKKPKLKHKGNMDLDNISYTIALPDICTKVPLGGTKSRVS